LSIAVISDIHGNLDALEAVLADIDRLGIERILCLGDNIGYGPEPGQVIERLRSLQIPSVIGNHELAATRRKYLSWFNPSARRSLLQTVEMLSEADLRYAGSLPNCLVDAGARMVHGFPPDSPLTYLFQVSEEKMIQRLKGLQEPVCFVGHTHDLEIVSFDGKAFSLDRLKEGVRALDPGGKYIVNIGSVGQPRDGDNRAKYAVWTPEQSTVEIRFVAYDIEATARKILKAGLPRSHAMRLF
jgi:diadenosine tetraphosphatase ApaH/serine/threonine PP2A family protein phosphatase